MSSNFQQSRDVLHPIAFEFANKCSTLETQLSTLEVRAVNYLVKQLIAYNLWDKFKAIYPFIGGNESTHSLNLKNLERHTIVWYNKQDLVHNKQGVTNNNSGYGNTMVAPSWFNDDNIHVSVYNTLYWNKLNDVAPVIGATAKGNKWMHTIYLRSLPEIIRPYPQASQAPIFTYSCGESVNDSIRFAGSDASSFAHAETYGFIVGVNGIKCYVNGKLYGREGTSSDVSSLPINNINKRTINNVTAHVPDISQFPFLLFTNDKFPSSIGKAKTNIRFASIGYYLDDEDNKNFYNIVHEFQTILNRQVPPLPINFLERQMLERYLLPNIKINKLSHVTSNPYRELVDKSHNPREQIKINTFYPNVKIFKMEAIGPRRIFLIDRVGASVSILSLSEL